LRDARLRALLEKGIERGYPGIAMLIERPGTGLRAEAVGYSDLEHRTPLRTDDRFQLASITKTFTAAAALRLVDAGRLSPRSTLSEVLGDAVARIPHAREITVAQLLDHSSGIYPTNNDPDYLATLLGLRADPTRVSTRRRKWSPLADESSPKTRAEPGDGHHYSDTNYILLGMIVERVAGEPLKRHVARTIFEPLGMRSTFYYSDRLPAAGRPPATVQGYLLATKEIRSAISIAPMFPTVEKRKNGDLLNTTPAAERIDAAGGIVSTLPDLAKFAAVLFRGKLLSPPSQKILFAAGEGMEKEKIGKHRTWTLQSVRTPAGVFLYKEGDGPGGVNTLMAYSPAEDEIFLGFTNIFGNFDEIDFMIDDVVVPMLAPGSAKHP
jgi:D-alanyl-D-alanine carboxypeptidase